MDATREGTRNLNPSPDDDAHQEVRDDAGDGHHQALDDSHARVEAEHEEEVVREARMKPDHEVAQSPRDESDHY